MRTVPVILLVALLLASASLHAQQPSGQPSGQPSWRNVWTLGMAGGEIPTGLGLDARGNIYMTGTTRDFNQTDPRRVFTQLLASWRPDGTLRWRRSIATTQLNLSRRAVMALDADGNSYVALSFVGRGLTIDRGDTLLELGQGLRGNFIVLKYDADGMLDWYKIVTSSDSLMATSIALTADGIWLGGSFRGAIDLGPSHLTSAGGSDIFLARMAPDGELRMAVRAGGSGTDICEGLAATVSGSLMMIGEFGGQASFGAQTVDAGGTSSYFVARWRADGSIDGVVADGGGSYRPPMDFTWQPMTLHVDRAGNSYVGISYLNTIRIGDSSYRSASEADAAVVMYRADGSRAWTHVYSGMWLQLVQGMTTDADGNLYVSGFSQDLPQGEVFVDKLSPAGELDWELTSGWGSSASDAQGGPMCVDGTGNVILAGPFGGAPTFGNFVVRSVGSDSLGTIVGDDIYIATIGATSGVPAMKDRDATDLRYAIARRGDALLVIPREDAPAILDATLYSTLGQRAAWTDGAPLESGATLRVELDGTARGAWLLVLRTAEGTACYPVMIAR